MVLLVAVWWLSHDTRRGAESLPGPSRQPGGGTSSEQLWGGWWVAGVARGRGVPVGMAAVLAPASCTHRCPGPRVLVPSQPPPRC